MKSKKSKIKIKDFNENINLEKKHKNKDIDDKVAIIKENNTLRGVIIQQDKNF